MRAINHALTGAIIGLSVSDPLIALPVSFLSHYVLDAIPHHGQKKVDDKRSNLVSKLFIYMLIADAMLCFILVLIIFIIKPRHWLTAIICAFLAASPDFFSFDRFYKTIKNKPWKENIYTKFASNIQWFEKPIGAVVEIVWFISMIFIIRIYL
jgi:hypothetical protein